jgi:hypothetical protein
VKPLRQLLAAILLFAAAPAAALEPVTQEKIVLRNRIFEGQGYRESLVPSTTEVFSILADTENVVTYRQTLEYYWPLSRQHYAAFDKLDEPLPGELRISRDGARIAEVAAQPYVVDSPQGASGEGARLQWGSAAEAASAEYRSQMREYNAKVASAQQDRKRYERELRESAVARLNGAQITAIAPPAAAPEPVLRFVTDIATGYPLKLPVGAYTLDVVVDGQLAEGSTRRLDVVTATTRSAVTIDILPEERWTRVLASTSPEDALYASPGARFYVVLNRSDRFDEREYRSLVEPQREGRAGVDVWVRRGPATGTRLEIQGSAGWAGVEMRDYKVRQTQGAQLGYAIEPAAPGETGDISAYAVDVPAGAGAPFALRVVDRTTGEVVPGTGRRILRVEPISHGLAWALAAVPLLVGIGVLCTRRARRRGVLSGSEHGQVRAA